MIKNKSEVWKCMVPNSMIRKLSGLSCLLLLAALYGCAGAPEPVAYQPVTASSITVPGALTQPFIAPHDMYHEVGPGETLWRIAKMYGVDMNVLMRANNLSDASKLNNGQKILIPQTLGPRPVIPLYPNNRWQYIIIHHTATDEGNARSINAQHQKRGFWNGLGYHFLIDNGTGGKMEGQVEVSPRWIKQQVGAHTKASGMNEKGIGIALVGNYSETHLSAKMFDTLVYLVRTLQTFYRIPSSNVFGHRDVPGASTECPGRLFPWREFKQRLLS